MNLFEELNNKMYIFPLDERARLASRELDNIIKNICPPHKYIADLPQEKFEIIKNIYWVSSSVDESFLNWYDWKVGAKPDDNEYIVWRRPIFSEANTRHKACVHHGTKILERLRGASYAILKTKKTTWN